MRVKLQKQLTQVLDHWTPTDLLYARGGRPLDATALFYDCSALVLPVSGVMQTKLSVGEAFVEETISFERPLYALAGSCRTRHLNKPLTLIAILFRREYLRILSVRVDPADCARSERRKLWYHTPRGLDAAGRHLKQALDDMAAGDLHGRGPAGVAYALVEAAMRELRRPDDGRQSKSRQTWLAIREYIFENLREPLDRDTIAAEFNLNASYVSRLFKQHDSETFTGYLTRLRLERAVAHLQNRALSMTEIARRCGYEDPAHFSRVFRRHHGVPPSRFASR